MDREKVMKMELELLLDTHYDRARGRRIRG